MRKQTVLWLAPSAWSNESLKITSPVSFLKYIWIFILYIYIKESLSGFKWTNYINRHFIEEEKRNNELPLVLLMQMKKTILHKFLPNKLAKFLFAFFLFLKIPKDERVQWKIYFHMEFIEVKFSSISDKNSLQSVLNAIKTLNSFESIFLYLRIYL